MLKTGDLPMNEARPLSAIARDIRAHWPKVNFAAKPYLDAMATLHGIKDPYYYDSGESVVRYFLSNASTWRGENAKRIKAELKAMLG
jgi:hypothetical protein